MSYARYQAYSTGLYTGTLIDEAGDPIPIADINSFTLTLTDAMTGAAINSRSNQNILNANNVSVNNTTGAVIWSIQVGDTTPASSLTGYREHVAEFTCTYQTSKVAKWQHRMRINNFLTLCTVEDVETFIGVIDTNEQPLIEMMIEEFCARAEAECNRKFLRKVDEIEYFSPKGDTNRLRVKRYPIETVSEIIESPNGDWASATPFQSTDYGLIADEGIIRLRDLSFQAGEQTVRVTYTGGLAREAGGVPSDLRFACCRQVVFWWQRKRLQGVESVSVARGGKEVFISEIDLLPAVSRVLNIYRSIY
jgi:hypothetical protein